MGLEISKLSFGFCSILKGLERVVDFSLEFLTGEIGFCFGRGSCFDS